MQGAQHLHSQLIIVTLQCVKVCICRVISHKPGETEGPGLPQTVPAHLRGAEHDAPEWHGGAPEPVLVRKTRTLRGAVASQLDACWVVCGRRTSATVTARDASQRNNVFVSASMPRHAALGDGTTSVYVQRGASPDSAAGKHGIMLMCGGATL